jgi:hypothetical protein
LGIVSLKSYFDMCHISVIFKNYLYCAWPFPVSYLRLAAPRWMNMTGCVWAVMWFISITGWGAVEGSLLVYIFFQFENKTLFGLFKRRIYIR